MRDRMGDRAGDHMNNIVLLSRPENAAPYIIAADDQMMVMRPLPPLQHPSPHAEMIPWQKDAQQHISGGLRVGACNYSGLQCAGLVHVNLLLACSH